MGRGDRRGDGRGQGGAGGCPGKMMMMMMMMMMIRSSRCRAKLRAHVIYDLWTRIRGAKWV